MTYTRKRNRTNVIRHGLVLESLERRQLLHGCSALVVDTESHDTRPTALASQAHSSIRPEEFARAPREQQSAPTSLAAAAAAVSIDVTANDVVLLINHQETAAILASQLLGDNAGQSVTIVNVSSPTGGVVELRDGVVFFTPDAGNGVDHSFEYTAVDGAGLESSATATLVEAEMAHGHGDQQRRDEHRALFSLIDTDDATIVAVRDGDWSDPDVWSTGSVPATGDRVLVHHTVELTYDLVSDQPLEWVRVDGALSFQTDASTRILAETLVSDPRGTINVGTSDQPIQDAVTAEILIDTTGGPMSQIADPTLVGRGFITHGRTNIHGSEKLEFTTLGTDAFAGANFIELAESGIPSGWRIGDTLLLAGTEVDASLLNSPNVGAEILQADANNSRFRDELLEITAFDIVAGRTRVYFNNVTNSDSVNAGMTSLLWNHQRPDGVTFDAEELSIHVANMTRNVVIRSSDPTVDTQQRGHFMVMHNPNAEIHHAQFRDLGRTDKRQVADDPAAIGNLDGTPGLGTNPRGRYGLHMHRLGANQLDGPSAAITGNVVWGTPGWGIVHHDSHAVLEDNVVFDVVGAGIVAEDGNELGVWRNNLVVKTTGDLVNNFDDGAFFQTLRGPRFDLGFFGSGYWVQGGGFGIRMEGNIAASTNAAGFDLVHHTDGLANVEYISVDLIDDPTVRQSFIDAGFGVVTPNNVPTRGIDGLVSYNGFRGIHTWLHNRDSGDMEGTFSFPIYLAHDYRSTIENYTVWGVQSGIQNFYSTRFDFRDGLVVGDVQSPVPLFIDPVQQGNNTSGLGIGHNHQEANHNRFDGLLFEGFDFGFLVFSPVNEATGELTPYATSELHAAEIANVEHAFISTNAFNPASQAHRFSDLFVIDGTSSFVTLDAANSSPTAAFASQSAGGRSTLLDASASFDPDPSPQVRSGDDGIVAYAWDLDADGEYDDAFGQTVTVSLGSSGNHSVGLMVWDDDGATATTSQWVAVANEPTANPWTDAEFSGPGAFEDQFYRFNSGRREEGWIARDVSKNVAGFAEIGTPTFGIGSLGQIVRDQHVHRGEHAFSFDAIATDALGQANLLRVRLFGINGQFDLDEQGAPSPIHAMTAPEVETLVDVNVAIDQIPEWATQTFEADLGADGFEYLVIAINFQGYSVAQGDYFALDNFLLEANLTNDSTPPQVESVLVNGGQNQRSRVTEVSVVFSEIIDGIDASSFAMTNVTTQTSVTPNVTTHVVAGRTVAELTFPGPAFLGGSLGDGEYILTTLASQVADSSGNPLDGDGDGVGGDDATDSFFRLFGDIDGDGTVDANDFNAFRDAFGAAGSFNDAFDANGDDSIDLLDFFEFRARFGASI